MYPVMQPTWLYSGVPLATGDTEVQLLALLKLVAPAELAVVAAIPVIMVIGTWYPESVLTPFMTLYTAIEPTVSV